MRTRLSLALVHYPCVDRAGDIYATSLTNLDVHDIARSARTFDLDAFWIVHPVDAQRELAEAIAGYWDSAGGRNKNADRAEALSRVRVTPTLEDAIEAESEAAGARPMVIATSARTGSVAPEAVRERLGEVPSAMLLFGTGHGLAPSVMDAADLHMRPIHAATGDASYNHLSVRAAVAITLDRLRGARD